MRKLINVKDEEAEGEKKGSTLRGASWARLLSRVFKVDVLKFECGGGVPAGGVMGREMRLFFLLILPSGNLIEHATDRGTIDGTTMGHCLEWAGNFCLNYQLDQLFRRSFWTWL